jgi:hypothetical protein
VINTLGTSSSGGMAKWVYFNHESWRWTYRKGKIPSLKFGWKAGPRIL